MGGCYRWFFYRRVLASRKINDNDAGQDDTFEDKPIVYLRRRGHFGFWCRLTRPVFLIFVTASERYFVLGRKSVKVVSMYSVLTSREPESCQVAFFNPS
jgi:hypothetical protein